MCCSPPARGNSELPGPPDPPDDDLDEDNNEAVSGLYEDGGDGDNSGGASKPLEVDSNGGIKSDESLRGHADDAEEEVLDLETPADNTDFLSNLTASEAWVARLHGRTRATSKVQGKDEWEYFESNILSFQG